MHFRTIRRDEFIVDNHRIVVNTSGIGNKIETSAKTPSGREFESRRFTLDNESDAIAYHYKLIDDFQHNDALLKYIRLTDRYLLMIEDLRDACNAAKSAADAVYDKGTHNIDRCYFTIVRGNDLSVRAAWKRSGLKICIKKICGRKCYVIEPPFEGSAEKNTMQAVAMRDMLIERGYSADVHYSYE